MDMDKLLLNSKTKVMAVIIALVIILFPFGYSLVSAVFARSASGDQPFLEKPDENYRECVRETSYMRFRHFDLLREVRDHVVREGSNPYTFARSDGSHPEVSLDGCWDCHTSRERFCNRCHDKVNLQLTCFRCHHDPERS